MLSVAAVTLATSKVLLTMIAAVEFIEVKVAHTKIKLMVM